MHRIILSLMPIIITFAICSIAQAARIELVKGKQVRIDGEGTELQVDEKYYVIIDGKRKGIVKISKAGKGKAIGVLLKGKVEVNAAVEPAASAAAGSNEAGTANAEASTKRKGKRRSKSGDVAATTTFFGAIAGYAMDSQNVKEGSGSVSMTGSGYSFKGFLDLPISGGLGTIVRSGVEQISLSGNSATIGAANTSITYLTADLLVRFSLTGGSFIPFLAGGLGFHYPISKSSNILDPNRIAMTTIFLGTGGFNYLMSDTMYLVLLGEYGYFIPSSDVTTNFITVRTGLGISW